MWLDQYCKEIVFVEPDSVNDLFVNAQAQDCMLLSLFPYKFEEMAAESLAQEEAYAEQAN